MSELIQVNFSPWHETRKVFQTLDQWDKGRKLQFTGLDDYSNVEVHFSFTPTHGNAVVVESEILEDSVIAEIPQFFLENEGAEGTAYSIYAFIYYNDGPTADTLKRAELVVRTRPKPEDYVYAPEELKTWESLEKRVKDLEENPSGTVSDEKLKELVNAYLTENPPDCSITVDSKLSETSENPVQNKVVKAELDKKLKTYWGEEYNGTYIKVYNGVAQPVGETKPIIKVDYELDVNSIAPISNQAVAEAINELSGQKADKAYVVAVFEELKILIQNGQTDSAIAVLDKAILDLSVLA